MKIFKLTPVDPTDSCWSRAAYVGTAIIRAKNINDAISISARIYYSMGRVQGLGDTFNNPACESKHTHIEELHDSEYSTEGPAEILSPDPDDL